LAADDHGGHYPWRRHDGRRRKGIRFLAGPLDHTDFAGGETWETDWVMDMARRAV
jgi:hypothetical protein